MLVLFNPNFVDLLYYHKGTKVSSVAQHTFESLVTDR